MKIEVRCPTCSICYLLDEQMADVDLACPGCSSRIELSTLAEPEPPVATTPPAGAKPPTEATTPAGPAPPAEAIAPAAAALAETPAAAPRRAEEVVCPRCQLHFSPGRATVERRPPDVRSTILVVEDLAYFREIAHDALQDRYTVITAETVEQARAALASGKIDLMILDLTLDGGDHGVQLLQSMPAKRCPVLIYTAQDESDMYGDSWEELRALGADDIVIKGMNVGESLLLKVDALLGNSVDEEDPVTNTITSRA